MLSTRTLATTALVVATQVLQVELSVADKNYEPTGTVQVCDRYHRNYQWVASLEKHCFIV